MVFSLLNSASDRGSKKSSPTALTPLSAAAAQSRRPSSGSRGSSHHSLMKPVSREKLASSSSDYIFDEAGLGPLDPEAPDLRELNNCLEALTAVFPDVQIDVFREMLSSFDGESRLALVADALLKNRANWVKGRWRVVGDLAARGGRRGVAAAEEGRLTLPSAEVFRTPQYKSAAETLARHEFKGLSRSTITAVLAETNYSYLEARRTLVDLSSKSWRFAISSLFRRRSAISLDAENHPLVIWKSSGHGSIIPCLKSTGNAELDRELFAELVAPLKERARMAQEDKDHALALMVNNEEAEELESTHECACCFSTAAFEEFTTCNTEGHMICFRCVQHSITEAVFGQGWHRSIDKESGTLRCPAVDGDECKGCVPTDHIHRAMLEEKKGAEIMHKLDQRLAEHSLLASNIPLVRCPFCSYAEVDDVYLPVSEAHLRLRADGLLNLICLILCVGAIPFLLPIVVISSFICLLLSSRQTFGDYIIAEFRRAFGRFRRRRRGLKFTCQSEECGRVSCLSCNKEWTDIHVCNESSLVALRTQVEQAMSMAIKRVCPRCNTSFVKTAGCNKLTCPCGYKMCYVCRRDLGGTDGPDVGYRHFCDHFRPEGDPRPCTQCKRCNLWESENTEEVLRAAQEEAELRWRETERRELSGAEKAFLETGLAVRDRDRGPLENLLFKGRLPAVSEICDTIVETIFV